MHIVIVAQYFPPDITAAAFRIAETASLLQERGHFVSVITARPHRSSLSSADNIDPGGIQVIRAPLIKLTSTGKWNYILHYFSFMCAAILASFRLRKRPDVVFASSPSLFAALAGWCIAVLRRAHFVLDVRDIWPGSLASAGRLSRSGFLYRWARRVELWMYRQPDQITCVSIPMAEYIRDTVPHKDILVLYNGVPESYLSDASPEADTTRDGSLTLLYVGNLGPCQNMYLFVEAARRLRQRGDSPVTIKFIGDGVERARIEELKASQGLDNLVLKGPVSKDEAFREMRESPALILSLVNDESMQKTIPSKVFDYMCAGRPILYGIEGEGKEILGRIKGNLYFDSASVESFLHAVDTLQKEYEQLSREAHLNRALVANQYTREKMVEALDIALRSMG